MASDGPDPQSLKSWQDAFNYPIPTVRRVEQELRRDIASNKEKLRALVGTRYRELVGTAETIVLMNNEIQEVDSTLADIGQRCNPRLIEKIHAHMNQMKDDIQDKDTDKRTLGGQLSLLHRCAQAIARLLRKRGSPLLVAKLLVVSRLLHKTLSQQATIPPFLDNLRIQLASLRRTLLKRIDKRLASAKSKIDSIIEALAAYCLATSSSSDDAIRHFHHVRLDIIGSQLESTNRSGDNVLNALQLYIQTLQLSKTLHSRQLSDVLTKLKARPLLADPDVRALDELSLDVLGRWVAGDVMNFTPWIKLSELSKPEAEKTIKQWSKQAFDAFVKGCSHALTNWRHFSELLTLRHKALEQWLSSWGSTPTHSPLNVLEGIRAVFNERLGTILTDQAKNLEYFGQDVSDVIVNWDTREHAEVLSLWDEELINLDYSNGAAAFKKTLADRLLGRDADISTVLGRYEAWLTSVGESKKQIDELKRMRWTDVLEEGDDEDTDMDIPSILNDDDTAFLRDTLRKAIREAFEHLQSSFAATFGAFGPSSQHQKAAFLLKLIRLVRRDFPVDLIASDFAFSKDIVPDLQQLLAKEVIARTGPVSLATKRDPTSGKLPGRSLWEGDPEFPVQPSPKIFRFLRRLVDNMDAYGSGVWDLSTVQTLKEELQKDILASVVDTLKLLSHCPNDEQSTTANESPAPENEENIQETKSETSGTATIQETDDYKIQVFFDLVYLTNAVAGKGPVNESLSDTVTSIRSSLGPIPKAAETIESRAHDYWKRTQLLFGLLVMGTE